MSEAHDDDRSRRKALRRLAAVALGAYLAPALTTLSVARAGGSSGSSGSGVASSTSAASAASEASEASKPSNAGGPSVCSGPTDDDAGCADGAAL